MITARSAFAYLAIILFVAALVFPKNTWAASGNVQNCQPGVSCKIGEFLYNDSYNPITDATCNITSRYPDGTSFLASIEMTSASELDGWYSHTFTTPSTIGLYRTEVKCTTSGETLALDKSFEVKIEPPTANDIASAVWGYSGRTLTTFGTLVSDIWGNVARTLTGTGLLSGQLASQSDVTSAKDEATAAKNDISTVKSDVSSIKDTVAKINTTTTTTINNISNNLLEQVINKPIIENGLEESSFTTTELQTKLEKSENLANQLLTSGTYVKSKTNLLKLRWDNLGQTDITKSLDQMSSVVESMSDQINWIAEQWSLPVSSKLQVQNKKLAASLKKINSTLQLKNLSSDLDSFIKLVGLNTDSSKSNTLFGQLSGQKELLSSLDKNYSEAETLLSDIGKNSRPQTDLIAQINGLSTQVAAVNQLPKMDKTFFTKVNAKMDQKQLKNKTLSLRGIVGANKQFLAQKPDEPLRSFWFEEGSIVFKTLISNPSKSISQKVPLKYYLPKEVTRENITKVDDDLTINYDTEKDQFYVSGQFVLAAGETRTLSVTVDDSTFHIDDAQILTMRKQAEELSKPLTNTAYFAQGVTLKTDIDVSLDKIESLQKNGITPELKIRGYRESMIEYKAAATKLEKLKELATNAGSVGTLFGFVGGAQAIAVWGLIIIMVAGFVFLALYMHTIRSKEFPSGLRERQPLPLMEDEFVRESDQEKIAQSPVLKRLYSGKPFKFVAVLIVSVLIGGSSIYAFGALRNKQSLSISQQNVVSKPEEIVLGSSTGNDTQVSYKDVNIFVPEMSIVTVQTDPSINSPVLTSLNASKKVKEIKRQDGWVNVTLQDTDGKDIKGWVDEDFIEAATTGSSATKKIDFVPSKLLEKITIRNTPTGFLRVRKAPGGEEITKISPGDQFDLVKEESGWIQIALEDGTNGWISKQYTSSL